MTDRKPRGDMQARILAYIEQEIRTRGYAPSVREIGEAVGLKSTSTVHGHLTRMEKKGLLRRDAMKPRAIGLSTAFSPFDENASLREIPVVGRVAAGTPILAEENIEETMTLPEEMVGSGELFILRVRGESMIQAGIMNDDYIVVHRQMNANNGEIVVAMIDDEATVKRFYKENGHIRLHPENDAIEHIIVQEVMILGKVFSLILIFLERTRLGCALHAFSQFTRRNQTRRRPAP